MLAAVLFCHQRLKLCHHDVKLENFVLDHNQHVSLIDFGFAVDLGAAGDKMVNDCAPEYVVPVLTLFFISFFLSLGLFHPLQITVFDSSPLYSPLEILFKRPHDASVDVHALGVCLYYMIFGAYPFNGETMQELTHEVEAHHIVFPGAGAAAGSLAHDLIIRMLAPYPQRLALEDCLSHPWLLEEANS
jgi:serine/threonine protein kinase